MQLNTTVIRHKRFSTYGWNLMENGVYKNTLSQGEIGVLLGHKYLDENNNEIIKPIASLELINPFKDNIEALLNTVLEVRLGTEDNQNFFDALLLNDCYGKAGISLKSYKSRLAFPSLGSINYFYLDESSDIIYKWNASTLNYYEHSTIQGGSSSGSDWREINMIYGGSALDAPIITY